MSAEIRIELREGPLNAAPAPSPPDGCGAVVLFEGVVRGREAEQPIAALEYEAYEPMASRVLRSLAESIAAAHGLAALRCEHSVGRVAVGKRSFRLTIAAPHRAEALAAAADFIDRMKRDAPLWKTPIPR